MTLSVRTSWVQFTAGQMSAGKPQLSPQAGDISAHLLFGIKFPLPADTLKPCSRMVCLCLVTKSMKGQIISFRCVCVKKEGFQNVIFDGNLDTCMGLLSDSFSRRQGSPTVWSAVSSNFITREHFLTHRL